ncbi:MAG TPA: hypothetical protein VN959_05580 [Mycobacterium sp.]|nr:hypothetical protein [Mycobacterium sp.]
MPAAAALDVYRYGAVTVGFDDGGPATVLRDAPGRLLARRPRPASRATPPAGFSRGAPGHRGDCRPTRPAAT